LTLRQRRLLPDRHRSRSYPGTGVYRLRDRCAGRRRSGSMWCWPHGPSTALTIRDPIRRDRPVRPAPQRRA